MEDIIREVPDVGRASNYRYLYQVGPYKLSRGSVNIKSSVILEKEL